jgi:zinc transport system ATP-binding protein
LKVILGLIPIKSGEVNYFFSHNVIQRRNIGYLPQLSSYDQKFPISVLDVVQSGLLPNRGFLKRLSPEDKQNSTEILKIMDITHLKNRAIGELSGGQLQRVFLARALISSPELLILDEPNTFVDKNFEKSLFEILKELNTKISIILVSHDLGMIASYVKTIACLSDTLHYHDSNEITQDLLDKYNCPIDLITHGDIPHRVLKQHKNE